MSVDLAAIVQDFPGLDVHEVPLSPGIDKVRRTLRVDAAEGTQVYKIDVLCDPSNQNAPWDARVYIANPAKFELVEDFPSSQDRDEDSCIRMALSFIAERT